MPGRIHKHPAALQDINSYAAHLGQSTGNKELERRFFQAVDASFQRIGEMPSIGSPVDLIHLAGKEIRKWAVQEFPEVLIFYREIASGVEILRVLNARQNWHAIL